MDSSADSDTIDERFRERVTEVHPDVNDHPDADVQFQRLMIARDVLSDRAERARYDRLGHEPYVDHYVGCSAWTDVSWCDLAAVDGLDGSRESPASADGSDENGSAGQPPNAGERTARDESGAGRSTSRSSGSTATTPGPGRTVSGAAKCRQASGASQAEHETSSSGFGSPRERSRTESSRSGSGSTQSGRTGGPAKTGRSWSGDGSTGSGNSSDSSGPGPSGAATERSGSQKSTRDGDGVASEEAAGSTGTASGASRSQYVRGDSGTTSRGNRTGPTESEGKTTGSEEDPTDSETDEEKIGSESDEETVDSVSDEETAASGTGAAGFEESATGAETTGPNGSNARTNTHRFWRTGIAGDPAGDTAGTGPATGSYAKSGIWDGLTNGRGAVNITFGALPRFRRFVTVVRSVSLWQFIHIAFIATAVATGLSVYSVTPTGGGLSAPQILVLIGEFGVGIIISAIDFFSWLTG